MQTFIRLRVEHCKIARHIFVELNVLGRFYAGQPDWMVRLNAYTVEAHCPGLDHATKIWDERGY